jgi:hypothetical protein
MFLRIHCDFPVIIFSAPEKRKNLTNFQNTETRDNWRTGIMEVRKSANTESIFLNILAFQHHNISILQHSINPIVHSKTPV